MRSGRRYFAAAVMAAVLAFAITALGQPGQLAGFDDYATKAMKDSQKAAALPSFS